MIFPVPVFLKRFAAALQVLILGIVISSLIRGSVFYFTLPGSCTNGTVF